MQPTLASRAGTGLEDLCQPASSLPGVRIRSGGGAPGIERIEAHLNGPAFAPHRHDTYALGITLSGIQTFRYRGQQRHCLPGEAHILHPDEVHDGAAGDANGFGYRIVYIDPALVQQALGGRPLPFVREPVVRDGALLAALRACLTDIASPLDELASLGIASSLADMLAGLAGAAPRMRLDLPALSRAHEAIAADPTRPVSLAELEAATGMDRWTLARQFRAAFGTSPSHFRTMRQLDLARRLIGAGRPLAEVALETGFADQSHMTRMFKRAYGLTPGQWAQAAAHSSASR